MEELLAKESVKYELKGEPIKNGFIGYVDEPENETTLLNAKQELFCQLYASDKEFFGNGVQSYIEAYDPSRESPNWYKTACVSASQLLSKPKVFNRINELLEEGGLNDVAVDKQLSFLINQQTELGTKLGAIKEYNALKARIIKKTDVTSGGQPIVVDRSNAAIIDDILAEYIGITKQPNESEEESDKSEIEEAEAVIEEVHSEEVHHGDLGSPSAEAGAQA